MAQAWETQDWSVRQPGVKGHQRIDFEDRASDYRQWRRGLKRGPYTNDVDQLEWIVINGRPTAVAYLELTRADSETEPPDSYRQSILTRMFVRDSQGRAAQTFAEDLGAPAYCVLYLANLSVFWVYCLTDYPKGWWQRMTQDEYAEWVTHLHMDSLEN